MQQELCDEYVKQFPLTMRIERLLRQFESGHHAVSVVEGITSDLIGCGESTKMTFLTQDQFKRTEKGLIVLIYSMICQFFPEIALIENATRMKFLQRFYDQFVPIYRAEMTVRKFSDPELSYAIVLPGGCVDLNNLEEVIDIKNLEHRRQISSAFCIRISNFMNKKYRPLNISRLEFASIVGLLFWNCVERILSDFIEEKIILSNRDQLYAELHAIIAKNKLNCSNNTTLNNFPFSPIFAESSIRFGRLLDLLSHLTIFSWESAEVFQMAKIFMDLPDLWDEINLPNNTK